MGFWFNSVSLGAEGGGSGSSVCLFYGKILSGGGPIGPKNGGERAEGWKAGRGEQDGKNSGGWRAEKQMTRATSHF